MDTTQGVAVQGCSEATCRVFQEHVPYSFAYKIISGVDRNFSRPVVMYRGEDAAVKFVRDMEQEAKQLVVGKCRS